MILTETFVSELTKINKLDFDIYVKVVNFAFNTIIKHQNQVRLAEVLETNDEESEMYLDLLLHLIFYLSKYRATNAQLDICLEATKLSEDKTKYLKQKLLANISDVRKKLFQRFQDNSNRLKDVQWRFEIEVASKTYKNDFKPNILLDFITQAGEKTPEHNLFACDYSNLKNMHQSLLEAFKLHDSSKHKKMIGSYL